MNGMNEMPEEARRGKRETRRTFVLTPDVASSIRDALAPVGEWYLAMHTGKRYEVLLESGVDIPCRDSTHAGTHLVLGIDTVPGRARLARVDSLVGGIRELSLEDGHAGELSELAGLAGLEKLVVKTSIEDVSALGKLPTLREVIFDPPPGRLASLAGLRQVEKLAIAFTLPGCRDVEVLTSLTANLRARRLSWLNIDVGPIGELVQLRSLSIAYANVSTVEPLGRLVNLRDLSLRDCRWLPDASPLGHLRDLERLDMTGCILLRDVSFVAGLGRLRELRLRQWYDLEDISPLATLRHLEVLDLSSTSVRDLAPLGNLPLRRLSLDRTPVRDLAPLAGLPLEDLSLANTPFLDVTSLARLRDLRGLNPGARGDVTGVRAIRAARHDPRGAGEADTW